MALHEVCHLRELGGYSLLQCKPCLVNDLLCVAVGESIRVYSVVSGQLVLTLDGHSSTVTSLCAHPHKLYQLLSVSLDGTIKFWAVDDGILIKNVTVSKTAIYGVKATSKAVHLIYGDDGRNVHYGRIGFPNPDEKEATRDIELLLSNCLELSFFCDEKQRFSADKVWALNSKSTRGAFLMDNHVCVFHIKSRNCRKIHLSEKLGRPINIDYNPREESIMTSHTSGQIRIFTNYIKSEDKVGNWRDHWHSTDQISMHATFTSDGNSIVSGGQEAVLVVNQWKGDEDKRRNFIPRLHSPIIWVVTSGEYTFVSMASNCIQIIHQNELSKLISSLTKSITSFYGAGATYDPISRCIVTNGRPGTIQFYNLTRDQCASIVDVTQQNIIIATGSMSNAANVTQVDIFGNRMLTVDRLDDRITRPRDVVRVWTRDITGTTESWIEEMYIERAHISAVADVKILSENAFITAGHDAKLKRWVTENGELRNTHVGSYRNKPILNLDISEDGTTVTTCDDSKCSIFSAADLAFQDIILPSLKHGQKLEKVYHGRGNSSNLVLVKHTKGFFVWDLLTCSCSKSILVNSSFELFRSNSSDLFALVEKSKEDYKISLFSLEILQPMVIVNTSQPIKSICFNTNVAPRTTGVKILDSTQICVLTQFGSLLEVVSSADLVSLRESSKPQIRLNRKNTKTPVGGLLSGITEKSVTEQNVTQNKNRIDNKKLTDLLFLPAYMMPNSTEYCGNLISTILNRPIKATVPPSVQNGNQLSNDQMEVDSDEESESERAKTQERETEDFLLTENNYESLQSAFNTVCLS